MNVLPAAKDGYQHMSVGGAYLQTHSSALLEKYLARYFRIAKEIAENIPHRLLRRRITILGCGDGTLESCVLRELARRRRARTIQGDMVVRLIDINRKFLFQAREEISRRLEAHSAIRFELVCGDFINPALFETGKKEIVLMLGCTFGNLGSEEGRFLTALDHLPPGSFLAIDMQRRKTRSNRDEEIKAIEPVCSGKISEQHRVWFEQILLNKTGRKRTTEASFVGKPTKKNFGGIPGGYRIVVSAISGKKNTPLLSFGRYDRGKVVQHFEGRNWRSVWKTTSGGYHTLVFTK